MSKAKQTAIAYTLNEACGLDVILALLETEEDG